MKVSLKNFPDVHEYFYRKQIAIFFRSKWVRAVHDWKEAFEKELREKLAQLEEAHKGFPLEGDEYRIHAIKEILGEA